MRVSEIIQMAINCPISSEGWPFKVEGESLILRRNDIYFACKNQSIFEFSAKGFILLTTHRIVFIAEDFKRRQKTEFISFDIPFSNIYKETFEQPVFGANYLKGLCLPIKDILPKETSFEIHFYSGGCQTFLNYFIRFLKQVRATRPDPRQAQPYKSVSQEFVRTVSSGVLIDPSDPTVVYFVKK